MPQIPRNKAYVANEVAWKTPCPRCGSELVIATYNRKCGMPYSCVREGCDLCSGCHDWVNSRMVSIELHCNSCHYSWTVFRKT